MDPPPSWGEVQERDENGDVDGEEDINQGSFCIYAWPLKGYGPKWHTLTSLRCRILITCLW
jgi:hypothetical protein